MFIGDRFISNWISNCSKRRTNKNYNYIYEVRKEERWNDIKEIGRVKIIDLFIG